jgi:hypothetical protein
MNPISKTLDQNMLNVLTNASATEPTGISLAVH